MLDSGIYKLKTIKNKMGILKKYVERLKERKQRYKDMQDEISFQEKIAMKKKNANERELETYLEEERQKNIQEQLKMFRKKKQDEMFHTNCFSGNKNLFNGNNVFANGGGFNKW